MSKGLTYKDSGVNVEAGYRAVDLMKAAVKRTWRKEVKTDIGGFGGGFALNIAEYKKPVLVSGTDGVGTKLKVAFMANKHDTVGIDLVAMCVNDILAQGAEPLFFLDYIATSKVEPEHVAKMVEGISEGCQQAACALIGGETAEMPGFYGNEEYDMAGFAVGIVEEDEMLPKGNISENHVLIGLASNGIHSNGYSLVRKIVFEVAGLTVDSYVEALGRTVGEELLTPTRIYVKDILPLLKEYRIDGLAHITGGGFTENIPRMLPEGYQAEINLGSWPVHSIFRWLQNKGNIAEMEMFNAFNMGIGMVLAVAEEDADKVLRALNCERKQAYLIGKVSKGAGGVVYHG